MTLCLYSQLLISYTINYIHKSDNDLINWNKSFSEWDALMKKEKKNQLVSQGVSKKLHWNIQLFCVCLLNHMWVNDGAKLAWIHGFTHVSHQTLNMRLVANGWLWVSFKRSQRAHRQGFGIFRLKLVLLFIHFTQKLWFFSRSVFALIVWFNLLS